MAPSMSLRDSRARAERAFQLRAIGRSWREVCAELGYKSVGAAQLAVQRHERRNGPEPVETSRRSLIESARITTSVLFDRFAAAAARDDDATAAMLNRELCRTRDQLARLQGAYAPDQAEVSVSVTAAEFRRHALAVAERVDASASPIVDAEVVREIEQ
ncbi:MAG: hypothetical protein K0U84_05345 [Actinomycetia bacterium]|nr:hypothetical protein [Actinomycetes bacterium]